MIMMRLVPRHGEEHAAPMMAHGRLDGTETTPTIPMILSNLLLVLVPLMPQLQAVRGEAL